MIILVHFGAPHGQPHHPSVMKLYEVIKDMHPMHQELSNTLSPNLLAQFVQDLTWALFMGKVGKSYYYLPCSKKSIFCQKALLEIFH